MEMVTSSVYQHRALSAMNETFYMCVYDHGSVLNVVI